MVEAIERGTKMKIMTICGALVAALFFAGCGADDCFVSDLFAADITKRSHLRKCNVRWERDDLPVVLRPGSSILLEDLKEVIPSFNETMGLSLLTLDPRASHNHVSVSLDARLSKKPPVGTTKTHRINGKMITARVRIRPGLKRKMRHDVLLHELGHVFGMAHTSSPTLSIMDLRVGPTGFLEEHVSTMNRFYGEE